ncbi:MAG: 50S ribosomal protein L4, partial [Bacteroidia bacterium]|nr:50S ribosomal protein L4 [Bacteroidia bacterium]
RKVKDLAKMSALSYKAKEKAIVVVEDITLEAPRTKAITEIFDKLKVSDKKIMFILPESNENVQMSMRNVPYILDVLLSDINTYDIVNSEVLVLTESAAKIFAEEETGVEA